MRYEIMQPGAFAFLKVQLEAGESIKAESDAMLAMPFTFVTNALQGYGHMGAYLGLFNGTICIPQMWLPSAVELS